MLLINFLLLLSHRLITPTNAAPANAALAIPATLSPSPPTPSANPPVEETPAKFGDTLQILGKMDRTDIDFVDGLAIDLFSPKNRTFTVQMKQNPLNGIFVTGSTGEGFRGLQRYSYVIKTNETTDDLIAKVELPYNLQQLQAAGIDASDTYVGKLAPDGKSWMIMETQRNVHRSELKTRIIKMISLDGEYRLLGRMNIDSSSVFVQFGQGETRTVNITQGPGRQETEFVDGLKFSVDSLAPFRMNVDLKFLMEPVMLPTDMKSLYSFAWVVNTTARSGDSAGFVNAVSSPLAILQATASVASRPSSRPSSAVPSSTPPASGMIGATGANADILFPVNMIMLRKMQPELNSVQVSVGYRAIGALNRQFEVVQQLSISMGAARPAKASNGMQLSLEGDRVRLSGTQMLDGEYVLLVGTQKDRLRREMSDSSRI